MANKTGRIPFSYLQNKEKERMKSLYPKSFVSGLLQNTGLC